MTQDKIKTLLNYVSVLTILAGIFGMMFCFPFLWSGRMEDLVGAGFPFVAGSVLFAGGLMSLTINNRK